jgi:hypothetical protein
MATAMANGDNNSNGQWQRQQQWLTAITMAMEMATETAVIRSRKQDGVDGASNIVLPCPGS